VLRKAMLKTIALINELIDNIPESVVQAENVDTRSLLNFALSDGHTVICTRYVGSSSDEAASLYYSSGTLWGTRVPDSGNRDYQMARSDMGADVVLIASEPLTFERENWVNVPTNSILTVHNQTVMVHPILDQYYDRDPHHRRSAAFARAKGLETNEKASARLGTPLAATPSIAVEVETQKKILPTIPFGTATVSRVRAPLSHLEPNNSPAQVPMRSAPQQPPSQGNIKKKRASLTTVDTHTSTLPQDSSPVSPEPTRNEFGNPNKIAQFFPELGMS
jgi:glutamine amidotransferase